MNLGAKQRGFAPFLLALWGLFVLVMPSHANDLDDLEKKLAQLKSQQNIGAIAYGIVSADEIISSAAIGFYSRENERKINLDSLFRIGSISKTFTALGALILENQSELTLSMPVERYLRAPPFINNWPTEHPITSAQLLEHTAGFRDMSRREFDQLLPMSLEEAFAVNPDSRVTRWPAGLHSSYSNSGAGVMTAILEAVSGKNFPDFMSDTIFLPLGLRSASFTPPVNMYRDLVRGYDSDGLSALPYWHQLYPAFGALNISTQDMLSFVQFFLNEGAVGHKQVVPRHLISQMPYPTSTLAAKAGLKYGYGKGLYQFQHKGVSFFGHGGDADGYLAFLAYSTELNRGYFVVINAYKQAALKKARDLIQNVIIDDTRPNFPQRFSISASSAEDLLGEYEEVTTRFASNTAVRRMMISRDSPTAFETHIDGGPAKQLLPVANQLFRRPWQSTATSALSHFDGNIYLQGDFGNFRKTKP